MRLPHARAFALALACFLLTAFIVAHAREKPAPPPRVTYEYKVISDPDIVPESKLNELGAQGWEFVQINVVPGRGSAAYFKRAR